MKKIIFYVLIFSVFQLNAQDLFIQESNTLKGSDKVLGQDYVTVYDSDEHRYRYFNNFGKEIFLIRSFDELGNEINLSIEKNPLTESIELILDNNPIGFVFNSIIYNLDMVEIGRIFEGRYSQKNINDFWEGVDYSKGNISIYDYTGVYKIGSFEIKREVDYYAILGIDKIENIDQMDARVKKKKVRVVQKYYKKLLKKYDLRSQPDNIELQEEVDHVTKAYWVVMGDLGVSNKKDKKILGIIPQDHFSEEKRSNWSQNEGYVPYSKRDIKDYRPDSKIQTDQPYLED